MFAVCGVLYIQGKIESVILVLQCCICGEFSDKRGIIWNNIDLSLEKLSSYSTNNHGKWSKSCDLCSNIHILIVPTYNMLCTIKAVFCFGMN